MKEQLNKRTMILLGLTVAAAVFLGFDLISGPKSPRPAPQATTPPAASLPAVQAPASPKPAAAPTVTPDRSLAPPPPPDQPWGRDPFSVAAKRLPQGPKGADQFSGFKLTGIVRSPQGYQALLNDRIVRPGDQVKGARVVRITSKGIELEMAGETRFLPLTPKEFLR